jgi:hypothetical protein
VTASKNTSGDDVNAKRKMYSNGFITFVRTVTSRFIPSGARTSRKVTASKNTSGEAGATGDVRAPEGMNLEFADSPSDPHTTVSNAPPST